MHDKVKTYLKNLPSPQNEICKKVRKIILDTFPYIEESFKNGVPWYECKYYIVGFKDHVNIGFSVSGLSEEQKNVFQGKGSYMRHIKLYTVDDIDEKRLIQLLKIVK